MLGESSASRLIISGTLSGTGPLGNLTITGAHVPGASTATVTLQDAYSITGAGQLRLEIGGLTPGIGYDQLFADDPNNAIAIGGGQTKLEVSLTNGFVPTNGDLFTLITTAGTLTGTFGNRVLPPLGSTLAWDLTYSSTAVQIQVVPFAGVACDLNASNTCNINDLDALVMDIASGGSNTLLDLTGDGIVNNADVTAWLLAAGENNLGPGRSYLRGDANLDSVVDGEDFVVWNANKFHLTGKWSLGDFNADGVTDGSDFITWNSNKFQSSAMVNVPEPATWGFMMSLSFWSAAVYHRRRFRRSRRSKP